MLQILSRGKRGLISKATINREIACLKTMLNYCVTREWISVNPLKGYKLYKEKQSKLRTLTKEEFEAFYNVATEHFKSIMIVASCTGMRKNEIFNLKWEDVDLEEGISTLPKLRMMNQETCP